MPAAGPQAHAAIMERAIALVRLTQGRVAGDLLTRAQRKICVGSDSLFNNSTKTAFRPFQLPPPNVCIGPLC